MKANELMLGDYVSHNGVVKIVMSIPTENKVALQLPHQEWGTIYDTTPMYEVAPVELAPEVFEKNGFTKGINNYFKGFDGEYYPIPFFIEYILDTWCLFVNDGLVPMPIKYVHELQHAMRLAGIKEDIVL